MPRITLYNSDGIQRTVGIWRYAPDGIIEAGYYDYATETLGPYKFHEKEGYNQFYYTERPTPPIRLLYQHLLETKTGLAAMFVNNLSVCILFPDGIKYIGIGDDYYNYIELKNIEGIRNMLGCGWVKTYMDCADVYRTPYQLQIDLNTGKFYMGNGKWIDPPVFPKLDIELTYPLYKELCETSNCEAVYLDGDNKKIYI